MRVGTGYDIHRLVAGRRCVLGGVVVPADSGPDGHSDADVLLHAIIDALLGAAALGDIGAHFPAGDPRWRGADSRVLLREVAAKLSAAGWRIGNIDSTVIAERPRLAPHVGAMRAAIAEMLGIAPAQVGVKAKTNEGVGPVGEGLAIAAQAVALIERDEPLREADES